MPRPIDRTGMRHGKLTVVSLASKAPRTWLCLCDCGQEKIVNSHELSLGNTNSCGCLVGAARTVHGWSKTKTYGIWKSMRGRCRCITDVRYSSYGGRGIRVCDRWNEFDNFLRDMGMAPLGMSLDRINNDGPYSPENCRWADNKTQSRNKSTNCKIEFRGKLMTWAELSEICGVRQQLIRSRVVNNGWTIDAAVTTPSVPRIGNKKTGARLSPPPV